MKVLLLGVSPLPYKDSFVMGPGIRTWQFTEPLLQAGHQVRLICFRQLGIPKAKPPQHPKLEYQEVTLEEFLAINSIKRLEKEFQPDCIVSAADPRTAYIAVQLNQERPVWVDQFGDLMAEAQVKSFVDGNDQMILHYWKYWRLVLDKGDHFSTLSSRNQYSLIGELSTQGRLNRHTLNYSFVDQIPCGVDDQSLSPKRGVLSGYGLTLDDFVVLWSGGYNTWTDTETLFAGLEKAMAQSPRLHFVSTGGGIPHHSTKGYIEFEEAVQYSKFKNRFHLLGWVDHQKLESIYQESHVAVNCDRFCYEAVLGSRNRMLNWLKAGLPIVSTTLTELAQILEQNELLTSFANGNPEALADVLTNLYKKRPHLQNFAEKRKQFVNDHYSFNRTTRPLQEWVKNPFKAPDLLQFQKSRNGIEHFYTIEAKYIHTLEQKVVTHKDQEKRIHEVTEEIERLGKLIQERDEKITEVHEQMRQMGMEFEKKLSGRNQEIEKLHEQMKEMGKGFEEKVKEHGKRIEEKDQAIAQLNDQMRQIGSEFDQKIISKNQEIGRLHGELAKLSEQIHHFQNETQLTRFEKEKLELQFTNRERDVEALIEQVRALNQEIIHRDRTMGSAYEELNQSRQKTAEQQEKIRFLKGELERMKELLRVFREEFSLSKDQLP